MNRADNQHRKRAIELLREDIHMADGPNEMFIGDFPYKDHVEAIVDAIMDAVKEEVDVVYTDTGWKYDQRRIFLEGSESPRRFKQLIESEFAPT